MRFYRQHQPIRLSFTSHNMPPDHQEPPPKPKPKPKRVGFASSRKHPYLLRLYSLAYSKRAKLHLMGKPSIPVLKPQSRRSNVYEEVISGVYLPRCLHNRSERVRLFSLVQTQELMCCDSLGGPKARSTDSDRRKWTKVSSSKPIAVSHHLILMFGAGVNMVKR